MQIIPVTPAFILSEERITSRGASHGTPDPSDGVHRLTLLKQATPFLVRTIVHIPFDHHAGALAAAPLDTIPGA